jgi:hypothetical protein
MVKLSISLQNMCHLLLMRTITVTSFFAIVRCFPDDEVVLFYILSRMLIYQERKEIEQHTVKDGNSSMTTVTSNCFAYTLSKLHQPTLWYIILVMLMLVVLIARSVQSHCHLKYLIHCCSAMTHPWNGQHNMILHLY